MSNKNLDPTMESIEQPVEEVVETPVTEEVTENVEATEAVCEKKKACKCKFSIYNLFAIVLTILPIALACVLPASLLNSKNQPIDGTFLSAILSVFGMGELVLSSTGTLGTLYTYALYVVTVVMIATVVMMVITLIAPKTANVLSRVIALANFWAYLGYTLFFICTSFYCSYNAKLGTGEIAFDLVSAIIAVVSLVAFVVLTFASLKGKAIAPTISFILSSAIAICYVGGVVFVYPEDTMSIMSQSPLHTAMYLTMLSLVGAVFTFSLIRMIAYKLKVLDLICFALNAVMAIGVFVVGYFVVERMKNFAGLILAAVLVSAIQVILSSINFKKEVKEKKAEATQLVEETEATEEAPVQEEAVEEPVQETEENVEEVVEETVVEEVKEETVEEPVVEEVEEEVLYAEPVEEEVETESLPVVETPAPVRTAPRGFGSAYMRAKQQEQAKPQVSSYDWFINVYLNDAEKMEFMEMFVFKDRCNVSSLPDYVPGGNNYEFFHKFFRDLGKYRNKVSDELLEKMYQYMIKKY